VPKSTVYLRAGPKGKAPEKDDTTDNQALHALNEIAAHDASAALVPEKFSAQFAHQIRSYATSEPHNANIGIEIPVSRIIDDWFHAVATLRLFKCKLQSFTGAGDQTYIAFKVTGGDKLILGSGPGAGQNDEAVWSLNFSKIEMI
jgi:hypothetical protein